MRNLILAFLLTIPFWVKAQRGDIMKHSFSVDVFSAVQGSGNVKYEFYDAPRRGITLHVLADFTDDKIPLSGVISRRYYFRDDRWSPFVAPHLSYRQVGGTYIPKVEDEEGNIVDGDEGRYSSRSTNLGLSIGYSYLGLGGLAATLEFGYGFPLMFNADWHGEPPTATTKSALKAIVPILFNITIGYAF